MKQFIVLTAMIALGLFLFQLILGPGDNSVLGIVKRLFEFSLTGSDGAI